LYVWALLPIDRNPPRKSSAELAEMSPIIFHLFDRRNNSDPLAHLSKLNVRTDRRHDRRALSTEEFALLAAAAQNGKVIETISGPDRAMMYVLAGWTGFRKGEIGSLTLRSFRLDDLPPTATVSACYSKRRRQDNQVLHPEVVRRLQAWLATKAELGPDELLLPVSGRVTGGKERKTHKMMQLDLEIARTNWINEGDSPEEQYRRGQSDFLAYQSEDGCFADFHSNRHLFIASLEQAGLSPKMAQTLARHSDVRLTLGVYTHLGIHDQSSAVGALPAPPGLDGKPHCEATQLRATGTDDQIVRENRGKKVPTVVPTGAENGAVRLATSTYEPAPSCTEADDAGNKNGDHGIALTPEDGRRIRTTRVRTASRCTADAPAESKVSPTGVEPVTFGFGGR
jgi:integrase